MAPRGRQWGEEYLHEYVRHAGPLPRGVELTGRCILAVTTHHNRASFNAGDVGGPATMAICHLPCRQQLQPGDVYISVSPPTPGRTMGGDKTSLRTQERLVLSVGVVSEVLSVFQFHSVASPDWVDGRRADRVWKCRLPDASPREQASEIAAMDTRNASIQAAEQLRGGKYRTRQNGYNIEWRHRPRGRYHQRGKTPFATMQRDWQGRVIVFRNYVLFPGHADDDHAVRCLAAFSHTNFVVYSSRPVRFARVSSRL